LDVGTSSYYGYLKGSGTKVIDQKIERRVITVFGRHKRRYGSRRIVSELENQGLKLGRQRVQSVLKRNSLQAIQPKSFVPKQRLLVVTKGVKNDRARLVEHALWLNLTFNL